MSIATDQMMATGLQQFGETPLKQRGLGFLCQYPLEFFGSLLWPAESYSWTYELAWEPGPWVPGYYSLDTYVPAHWGPGAVVGRVLPGSTTFIRTDLGTGRWPEYVGPPFTAGVDAPTFFAPPVY